MNFYPHHIGDYKAATAHLSNEEDLAYRRLLEMYYDTEKNIPLDTQWVSRRLRIGSDVVQNVLNDFFVLCDDGYKHVRCDAEILEYNQKAEIARQNGKKGGRRKSAPAKEKNPAGSNPVSDGLAKQTQALANHEPLTSNHKPVLKNTSAPPDGVSPKVWADFLKTRKTKITDTAISGIRRQAEKAGISLEAALETSCARGWQSFRAEWIKEARQGTAMPAWRVEQRNRTLEAVPSISEAPAQQFFEVEARDVTPARLG